MKLLLKIILLPLTILALLFGPAAASNNYDENHFNVLIAKEIGGKAEVTTKYSRRIDIVTRTTAWETDWLPKAWSEGVGQALTYAELTGKNAGIIVLIDVSKKVNSNHVKLVKLMAKKYGIELKFYKCNRDNGKYSEY